jgi:hypothetical protein
VVRKWLEDKDTGLTPDELLHLIATAVIMHSVFPANRSGIKDLNWGLFELGLCMLNSLQFGIPYSVFRLGAAVMRSSTDSLASRCLVQNLQYLRDQIDDVLFDNPPWYSWEKFGACFFAMRVKCVSDVGIETIEFYSLFDGAVGYGCADDVKLSPMEVCEMTEKLNVDLEPNDEANTRHHQLEGW